MAIFYSLLTVWHDSSVNEGQNIAIKLVESIWFIHFSYYFYHIYIYIYIYICVCVCVCVCVCFLQGGKESAPNMPECFWPFH